MRRIKKADGSSAITDRDNYVMVQTPQVFQTDVLINAYEQAYSPSFTDDASVVESLGVEIYLVKGKATNIKLTTPEDLVLAKALLSVF